MIINGQDIKLSENITVSEMLNTLNVNAEKVVVEVDMEIIIQILFIRCYHR